ncbi:hypothetical protein BBJ28_00016834 [Nothophytophthora sp. Chile5]|nr:hypothetical protein BBJ28_00016834 [Nothophytophthora sp. Chile5]
MQTRNLPPQRRSAGGAGFDPSRRLNRAQLPSHKLQCFSVACLGTIVQPVPIEPLSLPTDSVTAAYGKVLLELQCLKVPTPLLFKVQVAADFNSSRSGAQYCSVQEFSAPDGQVFLPYWLMQSLQVPEGGKVLLMETALRRYSILSVNSTIVVDYGTDRYYVRVVELKPASVISLCGDVDLETDFMPPEVRFYSV